MKPYRYLIFIAGCLPFATGCGGDKPQAEKRQRPAPAVRTASSVSEDVTFYDRFPATVVPLDEVEVRPQVAGYVTQVHFREGSTVRRGQKLYTIDVRRYLADVNQAESRVETARANLALAEKNVARYRRLAAAEAIALQTLDQAEAEVEARRQEVQSARAGVRSARTQLDYTTIRAPLSGVTSLNSAKVGTQVNPGSPLLTTIGKDRPVGVDFALPQAEIPRLRRLERQGIDPRDSTFRLRLPNDSLYRDRGKIFATDRAVDPRTGSLDVRLEFENSGGVLTPGMSLELEVLNEQSGRQIVVPTQALGEQLGEYYVMVVRDSTAFRQKVQTGKRFRDRVVIAGGLEAGKQVVVEGLKGVQDSTKVRVLPARGSGRGQGQTGQGQTGQGGQPGGAQKEAQ